MENKTYKLYSQDEIIQEMAAICAVMAYEIFEHTYESLKVGYIETSYIISSWSIAFFNENLETDWELQLDCWDDLILKFAKNKLSEMINVQQQ